MMTRAAHSLKGITLFAGISADKRQAYERRCTWRSYHRGEQIIDRESESRDVFFIISGSVTVTNCSLLGREVSFADLHDGDMFGELAAIDGGPRCATVVARAEAQLAIMAAETLRQAMTEHPAVASAMMKRLTGIVRASNIRIMELSTVGAHHRVCAELLRIVKMTSVANGNLRITPTPVHSDIASRVSTTRETVARVMSDLSDRGIIRRELDSLVVRDLSQLVRILEHVPNE